MGTAAFSSVVHAARLHQWRRSKATLPTEQTCGVPDGPRLSYSERHWFGLEDHRTGWTLWNRSEPHAFNVEGFGSLQVPDLQSDEIRPNQFGVLVVAER